MSTKKTARPFSRGATFIEILIVIVCVAILSWVIFTGFLSFQRRYALEGAAQSVNSALSQARNLTISGKKGIAWGVHFASSTVTVFKSPTYSSGNADNKAYDLEGSVVVSNVVVTGGGVDVIFSRLTGTTTQTATATVSLISDSTQKKLIIVERSGGIRVQ